MRQLPVPHKGRVLVLFLTHMPLEQFKPIMDKLSYFFNDYGIEVTDPAVCTEKEWTDFRFTVTDLK